MTPGTIDIPIYKGAKWEHTLTFKQSGTNTPVDLSGLGDFVMTFRNPSGSVIINAAIDDTDAATGVLVVSLAADQTNRFTVGTDMVTVGIRDALNNPYLQATLDVRPFTPTPATL
jgi:hypothetical protein